MNNNDLSSLHAAGSIEEPQFKTEHINDILMAGDKAKGARPYFLNSPEVEKVLNITMAVATELAVAHERIDTLERILESKGILTRQEIEDFAPNDEQAEERQLWHARYAARIMRIVQQEIQEVQNPQDSKDMHQIANEINEM